MARTIDSFVEKNFRWNFSVNLLDISFITLAFSLISRETITPLLVSQLTDSKIAVGFVPAIFSISFYLPQLFAANHAEGLVRKLPFVMFVGGILERVPYVFAGIAILLFAESAPTVALLCIYLVIGLGAFGAGVATPAWFTMIGKVLPVNRRGIFFGVSEGLGTLMGIIGAYFVGIILDQMGYPQNFARLIHDRGRIHGDQLDRLGAQPRAGKPHRQEANFARALLSPIAKDLARKPQLPTFSLELQHQPLELDGNKFFHRVWQ